MGTVINFNPSDIKDGYKYMLLESWDWRLGDNTHPIIMPIPIIKGIFYYYEKLILEVIFLLL